MFGRRRELDERERELNEREFRLRAWERSLQEQSEQLKVYHREVKRLHAAGEAIRQVEARPEGRTGNCEWCDYNGVVLGTYRVFNADTKRKRGRWLCSQECADAMDDEQRELAEGMQYVKQSLGVG